MVDWLCSTVCRASKDDLAGGDLAAAWADLRHETVAIPGDQAPGP